MYSFTSLLKTKRQKDTFWFLIISTAGTALLTFFQTAIMLASPLIFSIAITASNRLYRKYDYNFILITLLFYILYFWGTISFYLPYAQLEELYIEYPFLKFVAIWFGCFCTIFFVLMAFKLTFKGIKVGAGQFLLIVFLSLISIASLNLMFKGNTPDAFENFWSIILFYQTSMTIVIVSSLKGNPDEENL